ncbi:type II toxin-antitoxin system HicB family antitoxin [Leptospira bourretii]|uniref:Type II toxin-antitoxin system HicB family antitoxin n=1 Tax=Leptospira bourretii TaxID=2484962 RepID=A0A4R9IJ32_9LEPT|nr:type II toxin-antitoxin system HicB family antitoxin [Leptospira bourretii]TGK88531.1 type II toxin-antitoxin system HicB family antitoxin [Leptospira bourretii]TGK89177.1 type II toxin-antitoxin system HicB family antitoxin [Leptospira bourretii]TGL21469.1 type II toxin-antitoxin system HicB family antitoxin [Leptospira bourretii]TGL31669.1 type II toxin-antitoxin system HicB family antitoxin [Leptospira bourretii]
MKISYPAIIKYSSKDKVFNVEFPDLPGCITFGDNENEAILNAQEALNGYLESIDSRKLNIPEPSKLKGKNIKFITPEKNISFAIWLKKSREKQGLSQKQIAQKLNIAYQTYQKFEDPHKSNPTLKTIIRLEEVFHENLISV